MTTAIVVGTGPSIGSACVRALAADGADVVCVDRDPDAAEQAAGSARAMGVRALGVVADATVRAEVRAAIAEAVAELGPPGVLVNVVGGSRWSLTSDATEDDWDWSFAINLRQQWIVAQEVLPHLRAQGPGAIVSIASVSALTGSTRHGAYGAAKAGLVSLIQTLAIELAPDGIRVNAIAPGTISTLARVGDDHLSVRVPLGRRGRPEEIADAVVFLASNRASYITGQVLVVDGGVSAKHTLIDLHD